MAEINARFSEIAAKLYLTAKRAKEECGIAERSYQNYKVSTDLPASVIIRFCERYNVSPDYLLFGRGPIFRAEFGDEQKEGEAMYGFTPSSPQSVEDSSSIPYSSPSDTLLAKLHAAELQLQALTEANRNLSQAILNLSSK